MYHPRLRGNHHDMGRHYGELLAKSGIDLSPVLAIPEQQTAFGLSCLPIYEQYLPGIMQEVRGLADGLGQRYEAVACWLFALYCFESDHGCSVFAVRSGEHTYFGRNMDMFPEYKKTSESVLYMPENKNIFLAHSTAMMREILEQMLDSDLLLFSYPLYCYGMPAMLKNLIDRTLPLSSMAMAEVNGRHVHVGQWDYSHLRYLMICGCGFPNSKRNFEPAVRQFELLFPYNHTILTVPESPMFNAPEAAVVTVPRLELVKQAGQQYAQTGQIDAAILTEIGSPMIPEETYAKIVNENV